jgi:transcriptional regulator with XRE-family HTH domain
MFTGDQLRKLRQIKGIKQEDLAKRLGIKQQRYSVLENSKKVSEEKQRLILQALNYSSEEANKIVGLLLAVHS